MNDDNVRDLPLSQQAFMAAAIRVAENYFQRAAPALPDPELTLWDEVVRMRLSTMTFAGPGVPATLTPVEEAIDAANKVLAARRAFAAGR